MDMTPRGWKVALAGLLVALLPACKSCNKTTEKVGEGGACGATSECAAGECVNSVCTTCSRGAENCSCLDNGQCSTAGLKCSNNTCVTCNAGEAGCPCRTDNTCDAMLACMGGTCQPSTCTPGKVGCACNNNQCDTGLTCSASHTCATCTSDVVGCPCTAGACTGGLVCDGTLTTCRSPTTCANANCVAHQTCTAGGTGMDARCEQSCVAGFTWNSGTNTCDPNPAANCTAGAPGSILADCQTQHRSCETAPGGATCGTCDSGFLDNGQPACRAVLTCADQGCATQHRACTAETATADATCDACLAGYMLMGSMCVETMATCDGDGGSLSIIELCNSRNRSCEEATPLRASCTTCLPGYTQSAIDPLTCVLPTSCATLDCAGKARVCGAPTGADGGVVDAGPLTACGACLTGLISDNPSDPTSTCRFPFTCRTRPACAATEFCIEGVGGADATCVTAPCGTGLARDPVDMTCVDCSSIQCGGSGETGRLWPFYAHTSNRCVCETRDGYYADVGGTFSALPCDADGDGWVRQSARSAIESSDPILRSNARCNVHTVDKVELKNEWHQSLTLNICEGAKPLVAGACARPSPTQLFESDRNDDQLNLNSVLPRYGTPGGRLLRAEELNPLTKACVTTSADHNDNMVADIDEFQGGPGNVFSQMAYFVELHRGWYEAPRAGLGELFGRYVIQERSRCEASFPVQYQAADNTWWKECTVRREPLFGTATMGPGGLGESTEPYVNMDFGAWSCPDPTGPCPLLPPPVPAPSGSTIPPHGLCELGSNLPPADNVWRGMNHHSQFKCVTVSLTTPATTAGRLRTVNPSKLTGASTPNERNQFNTCNVACPGGDCTGDCLPGSGSTPPACTASSEPSANTLEHNPRQAKIACAPVAAESVATDSVGFVAIRPNRESNGTVKPGYAGACVAEWDDSGFKALCPGYVANSNSVNGDSLATNFGKLVCGCNANYGGPACDIPCPDSDLLLSSGYDSLNRVGTWMCIRPSITDATVLGDSTGYSITGEVPMGPTGSPMCQTSTCDSGYVLR